jgi:hypothetical protein
MIGAAQRYMELMVALAFERELAGGHLPPEYESQRIDAIDRCWREMSEEEQDASERAWAARSSVSAPTSLSLEDWLVGLGEHRVPRRKAA